MSKFRKTFLPTAKAACAILFLVHLLGFLPIVSAQTPPAVPALPPGLFPPGFPGLPTVPFGPLTNGPTPSEPTANSAPSDPADALIQPFLQLRFDRRPESVLQSSARRFDAANLPTNVVLRFQADVNAGDWPAVSDALAHLPAPQNLRLYDHVLTQLLAPPAVGGQGPASVPQPPMMQPGGPPPSHFLLVEDVLALANACPTSLSETTLQKLGTLLARALQGQGSDTPLLARLDSGVGRLGGSDPEHRLAAARLLFAANRLTEAARFLPPLNLDSATREFPILDLHASILAASADTGGTGPMRPTSVGSTTSHKPALLAAWNLNQVLLTDTNCPAPIQESALGRAFDLLPRLDPTIASPWLQENFVERPQVGARLLAQWGTRVARGTAEKQAAIRSRNLHQQRQAVEILLTVGGDPAPWRSFLHVLAVGWSREAEFTRNRPVGMTAGAQPQFDAFGNLVSYSPQPQRSQDPNQPEPIPAADLLPSTPTPGWLALLEAPLAARIRVQQVQLQFKAAHFEHSLDALASLASEDPKVTESLVRDLLVAWAEARQPSRPTNPYGGRYYAPFAPNPRDGIPLTRAHQRRNLDQLAQILDRLRTLPVPPPDDAIIVAAFTRAHSPAEVFLLEDIEGVLGPVGKLRPSTLAELLQTMRSRLATQWRQPRVQQDAKTKRNDREIATEVRRGYGIVTRLAEEALAQVPSNWELTLARATTLFDSAEFEYGQKVDLATYTARRDEAFKGFERAATLYAEQLPQLADADRSPRVYQQWFNATLGASDLAFLTRQTEPGPAQLARIRSAILALPAEDAAQHLATFARELAEAGGGLRPELKPRYLRAGLQIVGDHEAASAARDLVQHYDDLIREIVFDVRVDGDAVVGHGQPFGVFIRLLHTDAVGRESGGFSRYLMNQGNSGYYPGPYGSGPMNYRDEFEKQVREKFSDMFEVLTVTFADDKVQSRGTDRPGWREFPYSYLLLQARDASADTLPSLQLSMDFSDSRGQVSLPIASAPVLIDARPVAPPARPSREIEILQVLDDRDLAQGKITLEITASARGLVPSLDQLLDRAIPGFNVTNAEDRGLSLARLDTEAETLAPVSERAWILTMEPDPSQAPIGTFTFPKARDAGTKVIHKRYADADLVEVSQAVVLAGVSPRPNLGWMWGLGGFAVLAFAGLVLLRRRRVAPTTTPTPAYTVPPEISAFSVIHLLERLRADPTLALSQAQRSELAATTQDLQRRYFDRPAGEIPDPSLQAIAEHWVSATR